MAAGQYLLFAALLIGTRHRSDNSSHLLALILLLNALKAVDTLLVWSDPLRELILVWEPNLLFLGSAAYWLEGPLLYFYVSAVLYRGFQFRLAQLIHLIPLGIAASLLLWQYYCLPATTKQSLMSDLDLMWSPVMVWLVSLRNISIIIYGGWCLWVLSQYRKLLQETYANLEHRERRWLSWFVSGFVALASWSLVVHIIGAKLTPATANLLGIFTNYFTFFFVNSLVFSSIRYAHLFDGINKEQPVIGETSTPSFKPEQVARVTTYLAQEKPFLDANINMEILAKRLSLPERTFSRILNQHFGKNFFEFINAYRVEEAKRLLVMPEKQHLTMLDVLAEAGFSSKSTFNAIFKQQTGQTPSAYRQAAKNKPPAT